MTARTLHVRCTTWEQLDTFLTRKLRKGKLLSMKVPFATAPGATVTLGLELPNGVVIAIDGTISRASAVEAPANKATTDPAKTWIEIELRGLTDDVLSRIKAMASSRATPEPAPAPPPAPLRRSASLLGEELPADERELFQKLSTELRRLRAAPVHEVLGVEREASAEDVRRGWKNLVRRHHPDLVARRGAPAITHLAEELTILSNRAYDRLRVALVAEGRAASFGPTLTSPPGWLVGFEDISSAPVATAAARPTAPPSTRSTSSSMQGGEAFEQRARAMLGEGDAGTAREVLAAALVVYPRSRPLRSLYYVASALTALAEGEVQLAQSQLETALAHHEQCVEAAQLLEHVKKHGASTSEITRRLFR
jgi:hypothetical protein